MNTYSNRLDSLKAEIRATEQRLAAIGPASPHRFELTATLADLESELEAQYVCNAEGKKEAAERKAEQERQIEEHQRQEADALEADLRRRFRQAAPGGPAWPPGGDPAACGAIHRYQLCHIPGKRIESHREWYRQAAKRHSARSARAGYLSRLAGRSQQLTTGLRKADGY